MIEIIKSRIAIIAVSPDLEKRIRDMDSPIEITKLNSNGYSTALGQLLSDKTHKEQDLIILSDRIRAESRQRDTSIIKDGVEYPIEKPKIDVDIIKRYSDSGVQRAIQLIRGLRNPDSKFLRSDLKSPHKETPIIYLPTEFEGGTKNPNNITLLETLPQDCQDNIKILQRYMLNDYPRKLEEGILEALGK